jgi:hypothetical protein
VSRLRPLAIALLVIGTGLFVIGTSVEKNRDHDGPTSAATTVETHSDGGESTEEHAAEGPAPHSESSASAEGKVLGIDREATGLLVVAVLVSLALALLLWQRPSRAVWTVVGLVAVAFAVFDIAEVIHQLDESASGLAVLAAAVALAHGGTAGVAVAASIGSDVRG